MRRPFTMSRAVLLLAPVASACAILSLGAQDVAERRQYATLADAEAALMGTATHDASAPRIRVNVPSTVRPDRRIDPTFRVSEAAYAFVVSVDLDRRVHVLYPESPADVGHVMPDSLYQAARFFAGFGTPSLSRTASYPMGAATPAHDYLSATDGGGVIIAIASRDPLQLDRLGNGAGWNEDVIATALFGHPVGEGALRLGSALSVAGQHFNTDVRYLVESSVPPLTLAARTTSCAPGAEGSMRAVVTNSYTVGSQTYLQVARGDGCGGFFVQEIVVPAARDSSYAGATVVTGQAAMQRASSFRPVPDAPRVPVSDASRTIAPAAAPAPVPHPTTDQRRVIPEHARPTEP